MKRPEIRIARFYRNKPGDCDCPDMPIVEEDYETALGEALLGQFKDRRGEQPPTQAELIGEDHRILAKVTTSDGVRVTRVPLPNREP